MPSRASRRPRVRGAVSAAHAAVWSLLSCVAPLLAQGPAVELDPRRAAIVATAERFAALRWRATEANRFHGEQRGVRVDTPDAGFRAGGWQLDATNVGMPYQWGGFSSIEQFQAGIAAGRWAGHWPADPSDLGSTDRAVGVDCSGLVSRCLGLPDKKSTRSLGPLCYLLDDWAELLPGDIINRFDRHAMVFVGFADAQRSAVRVVESTWPGVIESTHRIAALRRAGMQPMRYKPLDPRWPAVEEHAETARYDAALARAFTAAAWDGIGAGDLPSPCGTAEAGEWVLYDAVVRGRQRRLRRTAARWQMGQLEVIRELSAATGTERRLDVALPEHSWIGAVTALFTGERRFVSLQPTEQMAEPGSYRIGPHTLPARRLTAHFEASVIARSRRYPVELELDAVVSPAVPLEGVLAARMTMQWRVDGATTKTVQELSLIAHGTAPD